VIVDEHGRSIAATREDLAGDIVRERRFPLAFIDRALLAVQPQSRHEVASLTARVIASAQTDAATRSWRRLWWLTASAAGAAILGVVLIGWTLRSAAELASMKSEFVATVTHDLKTPLALIRLVGETLSMRRYSSPETIGNYARILSKEASRLTLRIENLLTFARLTDSRSTFRFESVDLLDLVQSALRSAEPRLQELAFELDCSLTEAPSVRADRSALLQVLENLIDNAIKYSGTSRILTVTTFVEDEMACLSIQDRGIGIPPDEVARVFDKFFRGRNAGSVGSGLGLAIARRVVEGHDGTIRVDSEVNRGTTVTIAIPLSVAA
jgi:two-component system phosphate regulon sensor histidine kinase PhoR